MSLNMKLGVINIFNYWLKLGGYGEPARLKGTSPYGRRDVFLWAGAHLAVA